MQADFKNMVKEIFGYERVRDIPEEELMHLTKTYGYSPLLQFLYSRYLKEKNDRHYPSSVARTAIYFSNPHWLHHQLQKNHLDWIEDQDSTISEEPAFNAYKADEQVIEIQPALHENSDDEQRIENQESEPHIEIHEGSNDDYPTGNGRHSAETYTITVEPDAGEFGIEEVFPEETVIKSEDIYSHSVLDDSAFEEESKIDISDFPRDNNLVVEEINTSSVSSDKVEIENTEVAVSDNIVENQADAVPEPEVIYPEFDSVDESAPFLVGDTGFEQEEEEDTQIATVLPPGIDEPAEKIENQQSSPQNGEENSGQENYIDGEETDRELPPPAFRSISLPEKSEVNPVLSFEPLYAVDYFASQGVKLSVEEESRDQLTNKLKSFTEWLKSMKRLHPEKLSNVLDEKTELTIKTVAEHSNEKGEILTETMAEIFMKQGLTDKSMEVYEKLSLLYPSKSDYFAAKISALKAIGT